MKVLSGPRVPAGVAISDDAFARFFDLSPDLLAIVDAATAEIVAVNRASVRVLGYAADELTGLSWTAFLPHQDAERARVALACGRPGGAEPFRLTTRFSRRDGRVLWIDWSVAGPYDGLLYMLGRDGSAERRRFAALARLAERFSTAFEHAPIGLALVDTSERDCRRIVRINKAMGEILGIDPDAAIDALTTDFVHPDDRELGLSERESLLVTSAVRKRLVRRDGRMIVAEITRSAVPEADGAVKLVILQVNDVTEHAEAAQRLFDGAPVPMVTTTADGVLVRVNPQFCAWLGYSPDEVIGRSHADLADPEQPPITSAAIAELDLREVGRYEAERRYRRADGGWVWAHVAVSRRDATGGEPRLLAQMVDITDRKRTEQQLRDEVRELRILEELRSAVDEDHLRVYAQPICNLETREVDRYELLVRMVAADGTLVPPSTFLPTAERYGLISDIDAWVIERGVDIASRGTAVNINVSAASLPRSDLLAPVRAAVDRGLDPAMFAFEITETAMAADLDNAIAFAARAGGLGCRVVIDDFGVGFGSLTYVQRLAHVCCLKIDRTFVTHVVERSADQRIVSAVVCLAQSFDQNTVAEGIETEAALDVLRSLGVRYGQGYLFGRPAPIDQLFE